MMTIPRHLGLRLLAALLIWSPLEAQESRAELIAQQQAQKATELHPYEPGRVEALLTRLVERRESRPSGFFPYFDSVYAGGGFTGGAGYGHRYGVDSQWFLRGLYSIKNYKLIELGTRSASHLDDRLTLSATAGWRDATQIGYFGLGIDTPEDARANARVSQTFADGSALFEPVPYVVLEGAVRYDAFVQGDPEGSFPPIDAVYTPVTAPGLGADITYVHLMGRAGIDTRDSRGYSRSGGYYGATIHDWADVDNVYSFSRVDVDLVQHLPVLRETWVLSLRGRVQTTLDDDDIVPFFLMPTVGGGSSLRAYSSWRFRDRHSLLTNAEWRWIPNRRAFDMALFFDAGKVAPTRDGLDFHDMKTDWGIGARFHAPTRTVVRIEIAFGQEGWQSVWAASAAF